MKELNELTRRLLAEGYKPEDTPPGTCEYKSYYGGWTYTSQALNSMVFENPYSQMGADVVKREYGRKRAKVVPERLDR